MPGVGNSRLARNSEVTRVPGVSETRSYSTVPGTGNF